MLKLIKCLMVTIMMFTCVQLISPETEGIKEKKRDECECGIGRNNKIVGGTETAPHQFPWMCALTYNGYFGCGGSLISDQHVLTAAHCVQDISPEVMHVVVGVHNLSAGEPTAIAHKVKKITRHPGYSDFLLVDDIAILTLASRVEFNNNVRRICLPSPQELYKGKSLTVAGWGYQKENGRAVSDVLRHVTVEVLGNSRCRQSYFKLIQSTHICAGTRKGGKDACQGDSGGPLMQKKGDKWYSAGIVSYGEGCARAKYPGIYTRTNKYLDWISKITRGRRICLSE